MSPEWLDDIVGQDFNMYQDDPFNSFYCPYTNCDRCALIEKGWQPQELCAALECEQLKYFQRRPRRRGKAA